MRINRGEWPGVVVLLVGLAACSVPFWPRLMELCKELFNN